MTQVTGNDLKELKNLLNQSITESRQQFNELDKKIIELSGKIDVTNAKMEGLDQKWTESISNLDKRLTESISNLYKRVEKMEFVFRNVLISLVVAILIGLLRFFWNYPFSLKP